MNTIKLLDSLEVGTPLIVTTKWQHGESRNVTLYGGTAGDGIYNFIDFGGVYKCTIGYIRDHLTISKTLDREDDIFTLVKLIDQVKGV